MAKGNVIGDVKYLGINFNPDDDIDFWGNFREMCTKKKYPYHSLKMKKFPIFYRDRVFIKKPKQ